MHIISELTYFGNVPFSHCVLSPARLTEHRYSIARDVGG